MPSCLIVDDSSIIRIVARKIFQELGFDSHEVASGDEALQRCVESMPDVILLDWKLGGHDGLTVLREIRTLPGGEIPTILFSTTETDEAHLNGAIDAGATDYVLKPFDGEAIHGKLLSTGVI